MTDGVPFQFTSSFPSEAIGARNSSENGLIGTFFDFQAQETELVVKLKKKNSELTKNVTVFDSTVRDLKEKLSQLYNKCGAHERDMANLNLQLDQERQLTVKANERAQEIQSEHLRVIGTIDWKRNPVEIRQWPEIA